MNFDGRFSVKPLNLRDATYVLANLRNSDWNELKAQVPIGATKNDIVQYVLPAMQGPSYTICYKENPIAVFGVTPSPLPTLFIGFAFGTNMFRRAAPIITSFGMQVLSHWLVEAGAIRLEVRAMASHLQANTWLHHLGFNLDCPLKCFGNDGSLFNLYSVTIEDYYRIFPNSEVKQ